MIYLDIMRTGITGELLLTLLHCLLPMFTFSALQNTQPRQSLPNLESSSPGQLIRHNNGARASKHHNNR